MHASFNNMNNYHDPPNRNIHDGSSSFRNLVCTDPNANQNVTANKADERAGAITPSRQPYSPFASIPTSLEPAQPTSNPRLIPHTGINSTNDPPFAHRTAPSQFPDHPRSLRLATDLPSVSRTDHLTSLSLSPPQEFGSVGGPLARITTSSSPKLISRTPSLKAALANSLGTLSYGPNSAASSLVASPIISAFGEVTPLPSPLMPGDSPGPWNRVQGGMPATPPSSHPKLVNNEEVVDPNDGQTRKGYGPLGNHPSGQPPPAASSSSLRAEHNRNRSISEYVPEPSHVSRRPVIVSGSHANAESDDAQASHIRREHNYAESRGLGASAHVPTPPPSDSSHASGDVKPDEQSSDEGCEVFEAMGRADGKRRRWRAVRDLGQGTFSRVVLATSQTRSGSSDLLSGNLDTKTLVAVKVCEHGPKGGASEERVEMSLKRELEIMQSIHHPSVVDLKAWNIEPTRALLVLGYSPGGDLFDVATQHRALLTAPLLRRIFAELVGALHCLHEQRIVHRDVKLENVLVNLEPSALADPDIDWVTYPYSVITLTDLGLSRRIAEGEKLETRCGSDDYAAPEVILGQKYDGKATDAWSLGVLLYALLESRLPFDPLPGASDMHRMRSRTSHRIARVDWVWVEYAGEDGDHEGSEDRFREKDLFGAMEITEGLLRRERSRWSIERICQHPWVGEAIKIEGGLQFREEHVGEVVG